MANDGNVVELGDVEAAYEKPSWRLPDGSIVTKEQFENYTGDAAGNIVIDVGNGKSIRVSQQDYLASKPFSAELGMELPAKPEAFDSMVYEYRAPDGVTVISRADGSVPESSRGKISQRETDGGFLNLGIDNPRAPWQDASGNSFWEGDFDSSTSAWSEAVPWLVDAALSSAPYFVPGYRWASTAATAMPYLAGIDGSTRRSDGTYSDDGISLGQSVGGVSAPIVDALAERLPGSDSLFGGYKWFGDSAIAKIGASAVGEGIEEVIGSPFQQLEEDGFENYGREKHIDENTGQFVYAPKGTTRFLDQPLLKSAGDNFLSGAAVGGVLSGAGPALRIPSTLLRKFDKPAGLEVEYEEPEAATKSENESGAPKVNAKVTKGKKKPAAKGSKSKHALVLMSVGSELVSASPTGGSM